MTDPKWISDSKLIAITRRDGTQNLLLLNRDENMQQALTFYKNGEQVFSPDWDPIKRVVLFAYSDDRQRAIMKLHLDSGKLDTVLQSTSIDYRDPKWKPDHSGMYFSANNDGIFNVYEMDFSTNEISKVTSVLGGAFMPEAIDENTLIYSSYHASGYKIAKKGLNSQRLDGNYSTVLVKEADQNQTDYSYLNQFNDHDLSELDGFKSRRREKSGKVIEVESRNTSSKREYYPYEDTFTQLSIFPVVRFDNYTTPNGSNGQLFIDGKAGKLAQNLWRDTKVGVYMASREVIDRLTIYSGVMFGLGSTPTDGVSDFLSPSRFVDLDRDLFFIAEYQGLPFIETHWSPTVSVELYNLRRNVTDGVNVEEFPCVSCLPENTYADIAYDIWEADIYLRSKLNRFSLAEIGLSYSPYQVTINPFYSREYKQVVASSTSQYYIGKSVNASYYINTDMYHVNDDVAPIGLKGYVRYQYQPSELLDKYTLEDGLLLPVYTNYKNQSIEVKARAGFKIGSNYFTLNNRFFSYLNEQNEYFFLDYIGGLVGMRSYSFFALGGSTMAFSTLSWNIPLLSNLNKQVNRYTLDKLFARVFFEAGNGWGGPLAVDKEIKTGIGAELRFSFNTNYLFPTKFFVSSSYGFNQVNLTLPAEFKTASTDNKVQYGREWLFHFGLLFDFEL